MGPWAYSAIDARLGPSSHRRLLLLRVLPPHLLQVLRPDENLARLGALAGAEDPVLLHHVDEARGLRIAEAHAALEERDGPRALADHEPHAVPVEVVALGAVTAGSARVVVGRQLDFLVHGAALLAQELADGFDLLVGDPGSVHARQLVGPRRHEDHVAAAEELLA